MTIEYGTNGMPDLGANQMYYNASVSGTIDTMPDTPGLAVWHDGHIGVYIGDGYVIEAMNTKKRCGENKAGGPGLDPLAADRIHQLRLRKEVPMKQVNLTITFDEEKLSALKRYMGKKELDLDREMTDALVKLYEKYVPAPVREYIDESDVSAAAPSKPRRSPRTAAPKPDQEPEVIP